MPLFMGGGNVPTGDAIVLIETAFQIVSNSTGSEHNATADQEKDILHIIGGPGLSVTVDPLTDTIILNATNPGGGQANSGSNLATEGLFAQMNGNVLEFKGIVSGGDGIVVGSDATTVSLSLNNIPKSEIALAGTWLAADLPATTVYTTNNIGVLADVVNGCADGNILEYQTSNSTWVCSTAAGGGETNTMSSPAVGESLVLSKSGSDLPIKGISVSGDLTIASNGTDVTIGFVESGSENTSAINVGSGQGVFDQESGDELEFNSLIGGTAIDINDTVQDLTVSVTTNSIGDTQLANNIDTVQLADGSVSEVEFQHISTVTSNVQTQLNNKLSDITGESIHSLANVTSIGCATGEILKVNGTSFECAADAGGEVTTWTLDHDADGNDLIDLSNIVFRSSSTGPPGSSSTAIWTVNSDMRLNVPAAETFFFSIGGQDHFQFGDTEFTTLDNDIRLGTGDIIFDNNDFSLQQATTDLQYDIATGGSHDFRINNISEYSFNATKLNVNTNQIAGSMGCTNGQILEYSSTSGAWECGTDSVGTDVTTGSSLGVGEAVFSGEVGDDLQFKGIDVSGDLTIASNATDVTISYTHIGDGNDFEVSDGDKTDITVSASGTTWNIDTGVIGDNELGTTIDTTQFADGTVTSSEFQFINTLSSNAQTQLNSKLSDITGESIHDLANVTSTGCTTGEVLKVSGSSWECAADNAGGAGDIITEGDSNVEVIDAGTGVINIDVDGGLEYTLDATHINMNANDIWMAGGHIQFGGVDQSFQASSGELQYDVATNGEHMFRVNNVNEYSFNATDFDIGTNQLAGSMGCSNGQILEYNSSTDNWDCGTDDGGVQTPWSSDIDAGQFDLNNISNINFTDSTGPLGQEDIGIYATANTLNLKAGTSETVRTFIGSVQKFTVDTGGTTINNGDLDLNNNNIDLGTGSLQFNAVDESISVQTGDMVFDVTSGDFFSLDIATAPELTVTGSTVNIQDNNLDVGSGQIIFGAAGQSITNGGAGLNYNVPPSDTHLFEVDGNAELTIGATTIDAEANRVIDIGVPTATTDAQRADNLGLLGSLTQFTCLDSEILKYQSSNSTWLCDADAGAGGGITSLNSDSNASQNLLGTANEIVVTDTGVGQLTFSLGTNINATNIADGSVTNTEFQYINTLSSNAQTQLNTKLSDITGESIHSLANVTSTGCAAGEILKVSGSSWECAADATGSGLNNIVEDITPQLGADLESQGFDINSLSNIIFQNTSGQPAVASKSIWADAGGLNINFPTGTDLDFKRSDALQFRVGNNENVHYQTVNFNQQDADAVGVLSFSPSTDPGASFIAIWSEADGMHNNAATGDSHWLSINSVDEYSFNATDFDLNDNQLAGSMGCSNGQILEYNSSTDNWECGTDSVGTDVTTASNIGAGLGIFEAEVGDDLQFNTIIAGNAIDITDTTDDWTFAVTANSIDDAELGTGIDTIQLADGSVTEAEFQFINTLSSNAQTQLNTKLSDITSESIHSLANVTSTGCATGEILKVSGSSWVCSADGGSGLNNISEDITPQLGADLDADGFDINDLSNLEFRTTTGIPANSVPAIFANTTGMHLQVASGDGFSFSVDGDSDVNIGSGGRLTLDQVTIMNNQLWMNGNEIYFGSGQDTVGSTATGNVVINAGFVEGFNINSTTLTLAVDTDIGANKLIGSMNCADTNILEYQASNNTWICGVDDTGSGFATTELDNLGTTAVNAQINMGANNLDFTTGNVTWGAGESIGIETNDMIFDVTSGDTFSFDIAGVPEMTIDAGGLTMPAGNFIDLASNTSIRWAGSANRIIHDSTAGMTFGVETNDIFKWKVNNVDEYEFNATMFNMNDNKIVGSMGCSDGQILEYQTSNSTWICGTDDTGAGGITSINADATAAQVFSGVTNEVIITDTGAGTLDFGVGTDVVQIDTSNVYTTALKQTFTRSGSLASVNLGNTAGDPGSPVAGDIWYTSTGSDALKYRDTNGERTLVTLNNVQTLVNKDISSTQNTYGDLEQMANVVPAGCPDGNILEYQTSNSTWICGTDDVGGSADIISEGDSNVEVIDAGTGQVDIDIDGANEIIITATEVDLLANNVRNFGFLESNATNPAATGELRLGNLESIVWRNAANSADESLTLDASNRISTTASFFMNSNNINNLGVLEFTSASALTGSIRLANDNDIMWRNAANTAQYGIEMDANDSLGFTDTTPTLQANVISNHAAVTPVGADSVLILDATDSTVKSALVSNLPGSGETNTASSDGVGESLVNAKVGSDLPFKGLDVSGDLTISSNGTDITIGHVAGGATDIITEGDSNVEVIDAGTGQIDIDLDGSNQFRFNSTHFDVMNNNISLGTGLLEFGSSNTNMTDQSGSITMNIPDNRAFNIVVDSDGAGPGGGDYTFVFDRFGLDMEGQEIWNVRNLLLDDQVTGALGSMHISMQANDNLPDGASIGDLSFIAEDGSASFVNYTSILGVMESDLSANEEGSLQFFVTENGVHDVLKFALNDAGTNQAEFFLDVNMTGNNLLMDTGSIEGSMGCNDGQILKYQSSNSTWLCAADLVGTDITTGSSLGVGEAVFSGEVGDDLQFKGIDVSGDLSIASNATDVTISYTGSALAEPISQVFTCGAGMSQVTNTPNKRTEDGSQMDYVVCEFDTTTAETIVWTTVMPDNFNGSGTIDVTVNTVVDTGGSTASACFDVSFLGLVDGDVTNSAFGAVTGACTGALTIGDLEIATMSGIASGTHTLSAGETVFIKLARDVAADSNTGDVGVISIEVLWS